MTPGPLSSGALLAIASDIEAAMATANGTTTVYIVDAENGQVVYAHDPDAPLKPASNTKLFTTATAFDNLGDEHQLDVRVLTTGRSGSSVATLTVIGEHDFTWSTDFYSNEAFVAQRLADRIVAEGIQNIAALNIAGDFLVEGETLGTLDSTAARATASALLTTTLTNRGITVGTTKTTASFMPPAGATPLFHRGSSPLRTAAHPVNVYSNNEFSDMLARHNGYTLRGGSSYAEGAAAAKEWLSSIAIDTTGFELYDGSGLSHDNRVTARQVVELFDYMLRRPVGESWLRTMSIGGVIGTLNARMQDPDTDARFLGKTGTLNNVSCLSGVLFHPYDGHRYFVSILMNDVPSVSTARGAQDDIVAAVARDRRMLGERPTPPSFRSARTLGDGRIAFVWDSVPSASSYELWLSTDGVTWERNQARSITGTRHVAAGLTPNTTYYARVVAVNAAGMSEPSSVLMATTRAEKPTLLVVEGFDRWQTEATNPLGRGHDFLTAYGKAFGARSFDSVRHTESVQLTDYAAVFWELGKESTTHVTLDAAEQRAITDAIAQGVHFFISGSELLWDLDLKGTPDDQTFVREVLHASYVADTANTRTVTPVAAGLFASDGVELGFNSPATIDVGYPDIIAPEKGAKAELMYVGGSAGAAAISFDGPAKIVVFGFPFEALETSASDVMGSVLSFMGL
jgi:D-alanyl-D-alanine carboxypeptidase/D-alanyl-D-alanine-endopeptidase (penicillin-binding protein 4)